MNLTYGIIAVVGFLIAGILGMIAIDPGYLPEAPVFPAGEKPTICTTDWLPQCGVDGQTYANLCTLHFANVELSHPGECVVADLVINGTTVEPEPEPELEPEPTPESTPEQIPGESIMTVPLPHQTHTVSIVEGSSVPGCEETKECYLPNSVEIWVGDTVSWNNDDTAAHTVTAGSPAGSPSGVFDSSLFMSSTTFDFTFEEAGIYPYFCMVHPWMSGEIIVNEVEEMIVIPEEPAEEPIPEEPIVEEPSSSPLEVILAQGSSMPGCEKTKECFLPYQLEISYGEIVTWTNTDSAAHTVTSGAPGTPDGVFDSGMVLANQSWEFTFADSGEYDYYCMVHPWMTGKVMVI